MILFLFSFSFFLIFSPIPTHAHPPSSTSSSTSTQASHPLPPSPQQKQANSAYSQANQAALTGLPSRSRQPPKATTRALRPPRAEATVPYIICKPKQATPYDSQGRESNRRRFLSKGKRPPAIPRRGQATTSYTAVLLRIFPSLLYPPLSLFPSIPHSATRLCNAVNLKLSKIICSCKARRVFIWLNVVR